MTAVTLMGLITNELENKSNELLNDFQTNVYALYDQFNFTPVYVEPLQNYSKYDYTTECNHSLEQKVQNDIEEIINAPKIMESIFVNNNSNNNDSNSITNTISTTNDDSLSSFNSSLIENMENMDNMDNMEGMGMETTKMDPSSSLQIQMPNMNMNTNNIIDIPPIIDIDNLFNNNNHNGGYQGNHSQSFTVSGNINMFILL